MALPTRSTEVTVRYPGVQCVRQENRGLAEARNAGFRASTGDYVLFLDADDRLTPNAVESHLFCFAKNTLRRVSSSETSTTLLWTALSRVPAGGPSQVKPLRRIAEGQSCCQQHRNNVPPVGN